MSLFTPEQVDTYSIFENIRKLDEAKSIEDKKIAEMNDAHEACQYVDPVQPTLIETTAITGIVLIDNKLKKIYEHSNKLAKRITEGSTMLGDIRMSMGDIQKFSRLAY